MPRNQFETHYCFSGWIPQNFEALYCQNSPEGNEIVDGGFNHRRSGGLVLIGFGLFDPRLNLPACVTRNEVVRVGVTGGFNHRRSLGCWLEFSLPPSPNFIRIRGSCGIFSREEGQFQADGVVLGEFLDSQ